MTSSHSGASSCIIRLSQPDSAAKACVGLRFMRELEQGNPTLQLDKVNLVLRLYGHELMGWHLRPSTVPLLIS
ncbi:MAG: hypothetical protein EOO61_21490 [Hymenobacter sp.]|nr:MAG: hypothetical protein EOO61_21490 [Hymenobacter sp.]